MAQPEDGIRFVDILTTASAVANYLAQPDVTATHMLDAIAILAGEKTLADLGRPISPLVPRGPRGQAAGADPAVRTLVQRWWAELHQDTSAELDVAQTARLRHELGRIDTPVN